MRCAAASGLGHFENHRIAGIDSGPRSRLDGNDRPVGRHKNVLVLLSRRDEIDVCEAEGFKPVFSDLAFSPVRSGILIGADATGLVVSGELKTDDGVLDVLQMLDWQQIKHHHGLADQRGHGCDSGADQPLGPLARSLSDVPTTKGKI